MRKTYFILLFQLVFLILGWIGPGCSKKSTSHYYLQLKINPDSLKIELLNPQPFQIKPKDRYYWPFTYADGHLRSKIVKHRTPKQIAIIGTIFLT